MTKESVLHGRRHSPWLFARGAGGKTLSFGITTATGRRVHSLFPSAWKNSAPIGRIFMKFATSDTMKLIAAFRNFAKRV
jgi:hypothetical protein